MASGRFQQLVSKFKGEGKSEKGSKTLAAWIGRKKYGAKKFASMAAKGDGK